MNFDIDCEREDDGRCLAEVPQLPGVLACGATPDDAMAKAQVLALRVLAERLEHGAFHDAEEIGPKMLTRIAKHTGLTPEDL